jgi:septum formation protein
MDNKAALILGSSSPFRRELLERLQIPFTTCSPDVDETPLKGESPKDLSLRLSVLKAQAVAAQHPHCVVIGCDQVLELNGRPKTRQFRKRLQAALRDVRSDRYIPFCHDRH